MLAYEEELLRWKRDRAAQRRKLADANRRAVAEEGGEGDAALSAAQEPLDSPEEPLRSKL
eukprot:790768-Prorocentrum_minimum.AAC.1